MSIREGVPAMHGGVGVSSEGAELRILVHSLTTNPPPSHTVLQQVLETGNQISRSNAGVIYFADYEKRELICLAHTGSVGVGAAESPPRYSFAGSSFVARVFQAETHLYSERPWADTAGVDQRGVQYFGIKTPILGVPLKHAGRVLGVMVVWNEQVPGPSAADARELQPFALLAAGYLDISAALGQRALILQELPSLLTRIHEKGSQEEALRSVIEALGDRRFDRVRFFQYEIDHRVFVPVDCLRMDRKRFLQEARISADHNPYARHTVESFPTQVKARVYRSGMFGPDPDARVLDKPNDLPWGVVPLGLNGELIGQIVVDNAITHREITRDGLDYLDAMSALAVSAIASRRSIQFLSLNSLPLLYSSLSGTRSRTDVIKRLLVYLTCGDALGFSRAVFLEYRHQPERLVYRASIGSVKEDQFRRIAEIASSMPLAQILSTDNYDYEIDQNLNGFAAHLSEASAHGLLNRVIQTHLRLSTERPSVKLSAEEGERKLTWSQDLASRLGEGEILTVPLRAGKRVHGMFLVDRRWQPQQIRNVDVLALQTFSQLAAQILEQNELQRRAARRRTQQQWESMGSIAAHEVREPICRIENRLWILKTLLENRNIDAIPPQLEHIKVEIEQVKKFLADFRVLAHPTMQIRPISLAPLLKESVESFSVGSIGVRFEVEWVSRDDEYPGDIIILGDRDRLKTCFTEILTNSRRAFDKKENRIRIEVGMPPSSWLPLSLDSSVRYAVVHFGDNGCGIPDQDRERIFEPTFTTRCSEGGAGMGLYMVKRVIEAHNGMIDNYGRVGRGTTFSVFLPVVIEHVEEFQATEGY